MRTPGSGKVSQSQKQMRGSPIGTPLGSWNPNIRLFPYGASLPHVQLDAWLGTGHVGSAPSLTEVQWGRRCLRTPRKRLPIGGRPRSWTANAPRDSSPNHHGVDGHTGSDRQKDAYPPRSCSAASTSTFVDKPPVLRIRMLCAYLEGIRLSPFQPEDAKTRFRESHSALMR